MTLVDICTTVRDMNYTAVSPRERAVATLAAVQEFEHALAAENAKPWGERDYHLVSLLISKINRSTRVAGVWAQLATADAYEEKAGQLRLTPAHLPQLHQGQRLRDLFGERRLCEPGNEHREGVDVAEEGGEVTGGDASASGLLDAHGERGDVVADAGGQVAGSGDRVSHDGTVAPSGGPNDGYVTLTCRQTRHALCAARELTCACSCHGSQS